jgi:hypothetical protein
MKRVTTLAVATAALAFGAGCGGDSDSEGATGAGGDPSGAGVPPVGEACDLLAEDEVTEAIGEHDGGQPDYAYGGCLWSAMTADANGWTNRIRAAVLPEDVYRQLVDPDPGRRLPIDGFGEGATYDNLNGELWFRCDDQWCLVAAETNAGPREQIARQLASSLDASR